MAFEFKNCKLADGTEIKGLYEIQPKIFGDAKRLLPRNLQRA